MWVIRTFKDFDTKEILGYGIVDEITLEYYQYSYDQLRALLVSKAISVNNLEISGYKIKMRNFNPKQKIKYFSAYNDGGVVIYDYCIVTSFRMGKLSAIALAPDQSIIAVSDVTLTELATRLGVYGLEHLKLYNAYVSYEQREYRVYVYNHNTESYIKLPRLNTESNVIAVNDNEKLNSIWKIEGTHVGQEGLSVKYVERREGVYQDTLPDIFARMKQFGGGVNKLILPPQLIYISPHCFEGLDDLKELVIKSNIQVIPPYCCKDSEIRKVSFSGTEKEIGTEAFYDCFELTGSIVTNAEIIHKRAFEYTAITSVILLKARVIEESAFENAKKLSKLRLSEGLEVIKSNAFKNCKQLTYIDMPSSIVKIEAGAFAGCIKLGTIRLSQHTECDEKAFPKNVTVRRVSYK